MPPTPSSPRRQAPWYNLPPPINAAIRLFFRCIAGVFPYKPYYNKNDSVTNSFANRSAAPTKHRHNTLICSNTPQNSQVLLVDLKSSKFRWLLYLLHHDTYFLDKAEEVEHVLNACNCSPNPFLLLPSNLH